MLKHELRLLAFPSLFVSPPVLYHRGAPADFQRRCCCGANFERCTLPSRLLGVYLTNSMPMNYHERGTFGIYQYTAEGIHAGCLEYPHPLPNATADTRPAPSHSLVEVSHACCDGPRFHSYWMYKTVGSGMFYDVGRTLALDDHAGAYCRFDPGASCDTNATERQLHNNQDNNWTLITAAAKAAGYDSIQYTHRLEPQDSQLCWLKHELQDVRVAGKPSRQGNACPGEKLASHFFNSAGRCSCAPTTAYLNCAGNPLHAQPSVCLTS